MNLNFKLKNILGYFRKHKVVAIIVLLVVGYGAYYAYGKITSSVGVAQYITAPVERGTLVVSVSAAGQLTVSDQIDLKPKASGDLAVFSLTIGQAVKQGQILAQLDARDAQKNLRDAVTALETAKLELAELVAPLDELDLLKSENTVTSARRSLNKAKSDYDQAKLNAEQTLISSYEDGYSQVSNTFLKLPDYVNDLQDVLGTDANPEGNVTGYKLILGQDNLFVNSLVSNYNKMFAQYNENFKYFRTVQRSDSRESIYKLLGDTLETAKVLSKTLENARNMYDSIINLDYKSLTIATVVDTMRPKMQSDISGINNLIITLQNTKDTIDNTNQDTPINLKNAEQAIASAEESLKEKELTLVDLKAGASELDIRAKRIVVQQKTDALISAQDALANCYARAPFDGVVAAISAKKGDNVSAGTALATLITTKQIAEVSLNEVDIAKVKLDQQATISFDALENVTFSGKVVEIDTLGTTTQGVVNYGVKIAFDTQDDRVKPGMSVSVNIITNALQDALMAPNSAIKAQGNFSYAEMLENNQPRRQTVEVGLSNDIMTQIVSGLNEGDQIITQIIQPATSTASPTSANSLIPGGGGGGGFRMPR